MKFWWFELDGPTQPRARTIRVGPEAHAPLRFGELFVILDYSDPHTYLILTETACGRIVKRKLYVGERLCCKLAQKIKPT